MRHKTLTSVLRERSSSKNTGVTFIESSEQEKFLSYEALYRSALKALACLQHKGIKPGNEVVFQIEDNHTFVVAFWACILGGLIPVPLAVGQNDDHKQKLLNIWPVLSNPYLIISEPNLGKLTAFISQHGAPEEILPGMAASVVSEQLVMAAQHDGEIHDAKPEDIAFIQFSSGSTGSPKGVVLTHRNLITNMEAISASAAYTADDSMLSWMPLTHDMGLIGFHLNPLLCGMRHYLMPVNLFVRMPALWLDKASEHRVSILSSPNFGYKYFAKHGNPERSHQWDLSAVRIIYNGAEPISEKICNDFLNSLQQYGLKRYSMCPVYGLAEASLAVSISGLHDEVISVGLDRGKLNVLDKVVPVPEGPQQAVFVNVGRPVNHCSLKIADTQGRPLPDETIGYVKIKGDNVTAGYYNNDAETVKVLDKEGWLNTGDLGFIREGCLYITGRAKDVVFVNGQNYYAHDIERVAERVAGIELNKIAVAGFFNDLTQREEVIAFVFHRADIDKFVPLASALKATINAIMGLEITRVIPVKDIPRTTSGKLQRFKLLERYRNNDFKAAEAELERHIRDADGAEPVTAPEGETEQKLLDLWKKFFANNNIGVTHRFFDIGGNSLKAAEMGMLLLKTFQVELPLEVLYEKQSIRALAGEIQLRRRQEYVPLPVTPSRDSYPLTPAQRTIYYAWAKDNLSVAYNIPVAFSIEGKLEKEKLESCIRKLIARHDALRMYFVMTTEPVLKIRDQVHFSLAHEPCSADDVNTVLRALVRPFDLSEAPLFRITLLQPGTDRFILFVDFHHIISDGLSVYHFIEELLSLYDDKALETLPVQYKDYVMWEVGRQRSAEMEKQETFWLHRLEDDLPALDLPTDSQRPAIFSTAGEKIPFTLDQDTVARLRSLAATNHCTLHALMYTLYYVLLSKYSAQQDIVIGIPVAGRRHPDVLSIQGMFVNNLPVRNTAAGRETFQQLLQLVSNNITEAMRHQDYPFENLVRRLSKKRDVSRNPVFDTMFIYQNMGLPANNSLTLSRHFFDPGFSKFDISMEVFEDNDSISCALEYSTGLFKKETIVRLAAHFKDLIHNVLKDPQRTLDNLSVISEAECHHYVSLFNQTACEYPGDKTIHELFEAQVKKSQDDTAIEYKGRQVTYEQLNQWGDKLAALFRSRGVGPGSVVALSLTQSPELIASIVGILKAGGCYVPIDTELPEERIRFLITNSGCTVLVAEDDRFAEIQPCYLSRRDIIEGGTAPVVPDPVTPRSGPGHLAYIIYTSGTTGMPKGVMIGHRALVNYITWAAKVYCNNQRADFPLYTSISFDLTVTSIFTPLITGGRIVIYDEAERALPEIIGDNKVDVIKLTPSHLRLLLTAGSLRSPMSARIKCLIVGGEPLETQLALTIYQQSKGTVEIFNEYGPTEATVGCMIHRFDPDETNSTVPIGVPADNMQIYVLDQYLKPVPVGVRGELCISGDGLARGYLHNEVITAQKFIPHPFFPEKKLYRTGDIARRLPNGLIDYVGRVDQQVKVRGYRVELAEIESHLSAYPGLTKAIATVMPDARQQKQLCAFYESNSAIEESQLKRYLARKLPHYMVPVRLVRLESIPLTKNGKADHSALRVPEAAHDLPHRPLPVNEIETVSLGIWRDVLGVANAGITDNFFELGGDSIKAVQIASKLSDQGISVKVRDILTYHTIRQISPYASIITHAGAYEQAVVKGERRLLPAERWFFNQRFEHPGFYNQSVLLRLRRPVSTRLLEEALGKLVVHHDTLRTNYDVARMTAFYNPKHLREKFTVAEIATGTQWVDEFLQSDTASMPETLLQAFSNFKSGFDIEEGLLIKAALVQGTSGALLLITAHHLVMDGVSWRILLNDLSTLYLALEKAETFELPRKTASLLDWEREWQKHLPELAAESDYWNKITGAGFRIPQDHSVTRWRMEDRETALAYFDAAKTAFLLKEAHGVYKTDVLILLNTALALTLKEWTGLARFVIELEGHGRHLESVDVSRTLGWFTAMYPVKLEIVDGGIGDQIKAVKEQLRSVPHNGMGYGICRYLSNQKLPGQDLAEIRFNYLGQFEKELTNALYSYVHGAAGNDSAPANRITAKIEINLMIVDGVLSMETNYSREAHEGSTIKTFSETFFAKLSLIIDHIKDQDDIHFTSSDFSSVNLDQQELDALFR